MKQAQECQVSLGVPTTGWDCPALQCHAHHWVYVLRLCSGGKQRLCKYGPHCQPRRDSCAGECPRLQTTFWLSKKSAFVVRGGEAEQPNSLRRGVEGMLGEEACSSLGGAPSTRPTSKQPNRCTVSHFSAVFLLSWTRGSSCSSWRGKRLPLFPLDFALSRSGHTPEVSADARHVFSGVSPVPSRAHRTLSPSQGQDRSHRPPTEPGSPGKLRQA